MTTRRPASSPPASPVRTAAGGDRMGSATLQSDVGRTGAPTAAAARSQPPAPPRTDPTGTGINGAGDTAQHPARSAIELVGLVAAPTTLLTALALYFGWTFTNARALYFGLDASALGFSTEDYLLRSADALFVPLGTLVTLALGAIKLHACVRRQLLERSRTTLLRVLAIATILVGGALFAVGVLGAFKPLFFSTHYLFTPASPGIGILVLAYGLYLNGRLPAGRLSPDRTRPPARGLRTDVALVGLLAVLSAFWTASVYAEALGRGRSQLVADRLQLRPQVTVYSERRLHLGGTGVTEQQLPRRDSEFRYRYAGLRLLVRSDDKYFLLPDGWSRGASAAIVLPDGAGTRFEFGTGG